MPEKPAKDKFKFLKDTIVIVALVSVFRVLIAGLTPLTLDEAYYASWADALDWGYFDHPPAIAFLTIGQFFIDHSSLFVRLGSILTAALTMFIFAKFLVVCGLTEKRSWLTGMILGQLNIAAILAGILTTPDVIIVFAWTWALYESARALKGERKRWLLAGIACGIGILSKYTIVLIGPVFLWGLIRGDRKALASPWPYAGGIVAILVALPHFHWNSQNDWISFKFQLRHRFASELGEMIKSQHPRPLSFIEEGVEHNLAKAFIPPPEPEQEEEEETAEEIVTEEVEEEKPPTYAEVVLTRFGDFIGGQLGLWGSFLFPMIFALALALRKRRESDIKTIDPAVKPLLTAASLFPILFFGLFVLKGKVEANWSAMYLVGASPLLAVFFARKISNKVLVAISLTHFLLIAAVTVHANNPFLSTPAHRDRILLETHGYKQLAEIIDDLDAPVFADRYQLVGMLRFYSKREDINQWPGITRPSEFLRRSEFSQIGKDKIVSQGGFWLISSKLFPPRLPGYLPIELKKITDCLDKGIVIIERHSVNHEEPVCDTEIQTWYLARYKVTSH